MEARRLETLIAVARLGGLSKAAGQLDIAPSTAALHLSELERELGVRLTERAGRGIRLTDGGRQLLEHAESVLLAVRRMRTAAADVREGRAGTVRLGAIEPAAGRRLPAALAAFCRLRPPVQVRVEVGGTAALSEALVRGRLDLALCSPPPAGSGLRFEPLLMEPLDLLVPVGHPLAGAEDVSASDLAHHRLLVTEESCAYRQAVVQALAARGVSPGPVMEIGSVQALAGAVAAGLGVALVPLAGMEPPRQVVRKHLHDVPTALAVGLAFPEDRPLNGAASELAACLRENLASAPGGPVLTAAPGG